jgi:hypothetical protein
MTLLPLAATQVFDGAQLLNVVEAALIATVGVGICFSLAIRGAVRAGEARQQSRALAAGVHALLAVVAFAACIGAVVFGISVMLSK